MSRRWLSAIGPSVTTQVNANATPTFGIFVQDDGSVPYDPAASRIVPRLEESGDIARGATSPAVRTQEEFAKACTDMLST